MIAEIKTPLPKVQDEMDTCFDNSSSSSPSQFLSSQNSHLKDKPFKCLECPKSFSSLKLMRKHLKVHTREKSYKCDHCPKICDNKRSYKEHLDTHFDKIEKALKPFKAEDGNLADVASHNESIFQCKLCQKIFGRKHHLQIHIRVHTGERPYKCQYCSSMFRQSSHLNDHLKKHVKGQQVDSITKEDFQPNQLQASQTNSNQLEEGEATQASQSYPEQTEPLKSSPTNPVHAKDQGRRFKCAQCPKSFHHNFHLKQHVRIHTGERPYECDVCSKRFTQTSHLREHLKTHSREIEMGDKKYERERLSCELCPKTFWNKFHLQLHYVQHSKSDQNNEGKEIKCELCPEYHNSVPLQQRVCTHSGDNLYKYTTHLKDGIKEEKISVSEEKTMENPTLHESASTVKTEENQIQCKIERTLDTVENHLQCEFRVEEPTMESQIQREGNDSFNVSFKKIIIQKNEANKGKRFACDLCPKTYNRQCKVEKHKFTFHGEKSPAETGKVARRKEKYWEKKFQCEHCPKTFGYQYGLIQHVRTHTGEKPYGCHLCSKMFRQTSHLKDHIRLMHSNEAAIMLEEKKVKKEEKKFPCQHCPRTFYRPNKLEKHIRLLHSDEVASEEKKTHNQEQREGNIEKEEEKKACQFACKQCPRTFNRPGKLEKHALIHRERKDKAPQVGYTPRVKPIFQCGHCQEMFPNSFHLNVHLITHKPDRAKNGRREGPGNPSLSEDRRRRIPVLLLLSEEAKTQSPEKPSDSDVPQTSFDSPMDSTECAEVNTNKMMSESATQNVDNIGHEVSELHQELSNGITIQSVWSNAS